MMRLCAAHWMNCDISQQSLKYWGFIQGTHAAISFAPGGDSLLCLKLDPEAGRLNIVPSKRSSYSMVART
jgi:hypothetical protein